MWRCANCGEKDNEEHYKFCLSCGTPRHAAEARQNAPVTRETTAPQLSYEGRSDTAEISDASAPLDEGEAYDEAYEDEGPPAPDQEEAQQDEPAHGLGLAKSLGALGRRIRRAIPSGDERAVTIRVSRDAFEEIELLVRTGLFEAPAEAAAYLVERGLEAEADRLHTIRQKLAEIERLRAELHGMLGDDS